MAKPKIDVYTVELISLCGSGIEYGNHTVDDLKFQDTENLDVYLRRKNLGEQHTGFLFNDKILQQFQKTLHTTFHYPVENGDWVEVDCDDTRREIYPCT